jgi:hypothetical protein
MAIQQHIWGSGKGWVLAELGDVHVGYADARAGEAAQVAYLECQARAIEGAAHARRRRCVLNHAPSPTQMSATARKRFGDMLKERHDQLAQTVTFYVLVTPSAIVRGLSTAVLWLAPPPYPHAVEANPERAFVAIRKVDPRIEVQPYLDAYRRLLLEHVPDIQLSASA